MNQNQHIRKFAVLGCTALVCSIVSMSAAQATNHDSATTASASGFQSEMHHSMEKMNKEMMGPAMSGDPDRDFLIMMIPHHQGAVDMAKIQLKYGKDEKLKEMSQKIVSSQEKEISEMREMLEKMGGATTATSKMHGHMRHSQEKP